MLNFITLLIVALTTLAGAQQTASSIDAHFYSKETPYGNAATSPIKAPPTGYEPFFVENVGRHGSRTLTSSAAEARALKVWSAASEQGALTDVGTSFEREVRAFQAVEQSIGYGNMGAIGKAEWAGIGRRTADNYREFLTGSAKAGDQIVFKVTTFQRTEESADAMTGSLKAAIPSLKFAPHVDDTARLLLGRGSTFAGNDAVDEILAKPAVVEAAKGLLRGLYTSAYVDSLDDPVLAALDIYKLYCTAAGMQGDTSITFARYVPLEYAKVLAYPVDAQNFYQFGPGIAGESNSYQAARPLLADFFGELDKRIKGGSTAAVFRPSHGETIMPFAALIGAPGSDKQAARGDAYAYDNNPWRGYVAGRLGGNIEWVAFRNAANDVLVTMRYHEQPVMFRASCKAAAPYFYRVSELKRCLG